MDSELIKKFKTILDLEVVAEKVYGEHIEEFEDSEIRSKLDRIKQEEIKHIGFAKRMLSVLESRLK